MSNKLSRTVDLGRFRQGEVALLYLLAAGQGAAAHPTAAPAVSIYDDTGTKISSALVPPLDRYRATGLFAYPLRLGASYPAGHYRVAFNFTVGGAARLRLANFEVLPGGHEDGPVTSMTFYPRPHADFLVHRTESGTRVFGRNPNV